MEREMCQYLEWELGVTLSEFEGMAKRNFVGSGTYPTYFPPPTSKTTPPPSTNPFPPPPTTTISALSNGQRYPSPPNSHSFHPPTSHHRRTLAWYPILELLNVDVPSLDRVGQSNWWRTVCQWAAPFCRFPSSKVGERAAIKTFR